MNRRKPSFARALLLLVIVAVGPLQAQAVFACAMMEVVLQDECCCDHHQAPKGCTSSNCDTALESTELPCCERSVKVRIDAHASQDNPIFKPVELRSDADPPQALITSFDANFTPQAFLPPRGFTPISAPDRGGSVTYLVTQRLRI